MTGEVTMCASCQEYRVCPHEWHLEVERPEDVPDRNVCDECHESLRRFAGEYDNPLLGNPTPAASSPAAVTGFLAQYKPKLR